MNIACIIPARGGSKGIPKKNIIDFNGKPLIAHSINQTHDAGLEVYVSSDCEEILSVAKSYGAKTIKRPKEISDDFATSESAVIHAVNEIEKTNSLIDLCVMIQATSPLREPQDINNAINKLIENDLDSVFTACLLEDMCIWEQTKNNQFNSINYDYMNRKRRQDQSVKYIENGSLYVFKKNLLVSTNNRLGGKIGISLMESWKQFEIDSYQDLELCKILFERMKK